MSYPSVEISTDMHFDNIWVQVNGVMRKATGVFIEWDRLQDYLMMDDNYSHLIDELQDALAYSLYIEKDSDVRSLRPMRYALYPGLLNPDGKPGAWYFKGSDENEHLTMLASDHKTHKIVACTHFIAFKAHRKLLHKTALNIETIVSEQVERGVATGVQKAIAEGTATLKEIQSEKAQLQAQLKRLEIAEQKAIERDAAKAARQAQPRTTAGYVYVLRQVNGTHYKIGHTSNPDKRKHTFDVKLPFAVEFDVLIATDDRYQLERDLHTRYADKRVNGEWFNLSDDDLEDLRGLTQ
jgi:Meiotically Up-regulated Gene 113 (MUG113) protein